MAWLTPKTNWTSADPIGLSDMNRIEGNTKHIYEIGVVPTGTWTIGSTASFNPSKIDMFAPVELAPNDIPLTVANTGTTKFRITEFTGGTGSESRTILAHNVYKSGATTLNDDNTLGSSWIFQSDGIIGFSTSPAGTPTPTPRMTITNTQIDMNNPLNIAMIRPSIKLYDNTSTKEWRVENYNGNFEIYETGKAKWFSINSENGRTTIGQNVIDNGTDQLQVKGSAYIDGALTATSLIKSENQIVGPIYYLDDGVNTYGGIGQDSNNLTIFSSNSLSGNIVLQSFGDIELKTGASPANPEVAVKIDADTKKTTFNGAVLFENNTSGNNVAESSLFSSLSVSAPSVGNEATVTGGATTPSGSVIIVSRIVRNSSTSIQIGGVYATGVAAGNSALVQITSTGTGLWNFNLSH